MTPSASIASATWMKPATLAPVGDVAAGGAVGIGRGQAAVVDADHDVLESILGVAEARPSQVDKCLQTTRRFDALKLWLTLLNPMATARYTCGRFDGPEICARCIS